MIKWAKRTVSLLVTMAIVLGVMVLWKPSVVSEWVEVAQNVMNNKKMNEAIGYGKGIADMIGSAVSKIDKNKLNDIKNQLVKKEDYGGREVEETYDDILKAYKQLLNTINIDDNTDETLRKVLETGASINDKREAVAIAIADINNIAESYASIEAKDVNNKEIQSYINEIVSGANKLDVK